jgi:hypothetical protein
MSYFYLQILGEHLVTQRSMGVVTESSSTELIVSSKHRHCLTVDFREP